LFWFDSLITRATRVKKKESGCKRSGGYSAVPRLELMVTAVQIYTGIAWCHLWVREKNVGDCRCHKDNSRDLLGDVDKRWLFQGGAQLGHNGPILAQKKNAGSPSGRRKSTNRQGRASAGKPRIEKRCGGSLGGTRWGNKKGTRPSWRSTGQEDEQSSCEG